MRFSPICGFLVVLLVASPALAVIVRLIPLKDAIEQQPIIFTATIEKVDRDTPAVTLKFDEKLKGDTTFDTLVVDMTGDAEAKKGDHTKAMFERLDTSRKLVVFANKRGEKKYDAWVFVEGTWFSMQGTINGKTVRWTFLHGEPYLRRTFKGTTAELKKIVADALAKKANPPAPNEKETPGFGPVVESRRQGDTETIRMDEPLAASHEVADTACEAASGDTAPCLHVSVSPCLPLSPSPPLFGVIPSLAVLTPMALIAALFPGVAVKMAVGMKKWRAFLVIASVNSTLALVFYFTQKYLPNWWIFSLRGFTVLLMLCTAVGLSWAGRRYRRLATEDANITEIPGRGELFALAGLVVLLGLLVASVRLFGPWSAALDLPMREFTFIGISLIVALLYAAYRKATHSVDGTSSGVKLSLSGELVALGAMLLCGLVTLAPRGSQFASGTTTGDADDTFGPRLVGMRTFTVPGADQVMSSVTVDGDKLYFGASKQSGFGTSGLVFCLDRESGKVMWKFDDNLRPVFCTPTVADGKVFVGEGLHTDNACRLFCLDAATGKPAWEKPFETGSHTEGTPRVFDGKVLFSAGDDGLFAADIKTGTKAWHFEGQKQKLHIDTPPTITGKRAFIGSGYDTYAMLCLDAGTGQEVWRTPSPLRVFGAPFVLGNRVFYGIGTGNLTSDTEGDETTPAGAVVCLDIADGKEQWKYDMPRSAHAGLAGDAFSIYATSRDGFVHCLDRNTGKLRWKTGIGGAILAGAAVATAGGMPVALYAVSREGRVVCLNPQSGKVTWEAQLPGFTWDGQEANGVFGTPAIVTNGNKRTIYIGAMTVTTNTRRKTCAVFRFDDEIPE